VIGVAAFVGRCQNDLHSQRREQLEYKANQQGQPESGFLIRNP
jgi:hypothetical protein